MFDRSFCSNIDDFVIVSSLLIPVAGYRFSGYFSIRFYPELLSFILVDEIRPYIPPFLWTFIVSWIPVQYFACPVIIFPSSIAI